MYLLFFAIPSFVTTHNKQKRRCFLWVLPWNYRKNNMTWARTGEGELSDTKYLVLRHSLLKSLQARRTGQASLGPRAGHGRRWCESGVCRGPFSYVRQQRHLGLYVSCFDLEAQHEHKNDCKEPRSAPGPASCPGQEPADAQEEIQK